MHNIIKMKDLTLHSITKYLKTLIIIVIVTLTAYTKTEPTSINLKQRTLTDLTATTYNFTVNDNSAFINSINDLTDFTSTAELTTAASSNNCISKFLPLISSLPANVQSAIISEFKIHATETTSDGSCCNSKRLIDAVSPLFNINLKSFSNLMTRQSNNIKSGYGGIRASEVLDSVIGANTTSATVTNNKKIINDLINNQNQLNTDLIKCATHINSFRIKNAGLMCLDSTAVSKLFNIGSNGLVYSIKNNNDDFYNIFERCIEYVQDFSNYSDIIFNSFFSNLNYAIGSDQCNYFSNFFGFDLNDDINDVLYPDEVNSFDNNSTATDLLTKWSTCAIQYLNFSIYNVTDFITTVNYSITTNPNGLSTYIGRSDINYDKIKAGFYLNSVNTFYLSCLGTNDCSYVCIDCDDLNFDNDNIIMSNTTDLNLTCCNNICIVVVKIEDTYENNLIDLYGAEIFDMNTNDELQDISDLLQTKLRNAALQFDSINTNNSTDSLLFEIKNIVKNVDNYTVDYRMETILDLMISDTNKKVTSVSDYFYNVLLNGTNNFTFTCINKVCNLVSDNYNNQQFNLYSNVTPVSSSKNNNTTNKTRKKYKPYSEIIENDQNISDNSNSNRKKYKPYTETFDDNNNHTAYNNSEEQGRNLASRSKSSSSKSSSSKSSSSKSSSSKSSSSKSGSTSTGSKSGSTSSSSKSGSSLTSKSTSSLKTTKSPTTSTASSSKSGSSLTKKASTASTSNTKKFSSSDSKYVSSGSGANSKKSTFTQSSAGKNGLADYSSNNNINSYNSIRNTNNYASSNYNTYSTSTRPNSKFINYYQSSSVNYGYSSGIGRYSSYNYYSTVHRSYYRNYYLYNYHSRYRRPTYYSYTDFEASDLPYLAAEYDPADWAPNSEPLFNATDYLSVVAADLNNVKIYIECNSIFCVTYITEINDGYADEDNGDKRIFVDVNLRNIDYIKQNKLSLQQIKCLIKDFITKYNSTIIETTIQNKIADNSLTVCGIPSTFDIFPITDKCSKSIATTLKAVHYDDLINRIIPFKSTNSNSDASSSTFSISELSVCSSLQLNKTNYGTCGQLFKDAFISNGLKINFKALVYPFTKYNNSQSTKTRGLRLLTDDSSNTASSSNNSTVSDPNNDLNSQQKAQYSEVATYSQSKSDNSTTIDGSSTSTPASASNDDTTIANSYADNQISNNNSSQYLKNMGFYSYLLILIIKIIIFM